MRIAIMQPTYAPWSGYFHLIGSVDRFVFLDDVPMAQQRPNWQRENRIMTNNGPRWLRVPVSRPQGPETLLKDVLIKNEAWREAHQTLLHETFSQSGNYNDHGERISGAIHTPSCHLADINIALIISISELLGFETEFVRACELSDIQGSKAARLIAIIKALGGTSYLSPRGAAEYCTSEIFNAAGIELSFQNFVPPTYPQGPLAFQSHFSILDIVLRDTLDGAALIRTGDRPALPSIITPLESADDPN